MQKHKFLPCARLVERKSEIVRYSNGKTVLSIGMGGYVYDPAKTDKWVGRGLTQTVHAKVSEVSVNLVGLDINPTAIEAMRKLVPGVYHVGDITEKGMYKKIGQKFNLILFTEVIEHLDCFRDALTNMRSMLTSEGEILITTVNAFCFERIGKMFFRYESVHDEHTSYFSYLTMRRLLAMNGFEITKFCFYNQTRDTFDSFVERLGYYAMLGVSTLFPQFAEGIFVVAKPVDQDFSNETNVSS